MGEPFFDRGQVAEAVSGDAPVDELDSLADEELLRRYRDARGPEVFTEMVRRHQPMVLRTCLRLVGNIHDAEDAAQSVFLVLAQRPEVVQRSLAGCLHNLARAAVSELCRSRRRRSEREQLAARINSMFTRLLGRGHAMEHPMEHYELGEELDIALAQLSDPLRQAVILRYLEGHSQKEAAQQAGCTQVTMGWRSMKGLKQLRTILGRRGVVLPATALLAVLKAEAQAAVALGLGSAATGPATATAVSLAATLARQVVVGNVFRKTLLVVLLTTVVGLGAGIIGLSATKKESPPNPAPQSKGPPAEAVLSRLGLFNRSLDIGGPAREGSAQFARDVYAIQGGGKHIYEKADQFRFVCRAWTGDGEIRARITSDPDQEARQVHAGVMFRERLEPDSQHVSILLSAGDWHVKYRTTDCPASACDINRLDAPGKHWVRLVRRGNTFTSFIRADGTEEWKRVKEMELGLAPSLYVGLAVTAHDDTQLAIATFDRVSVEK